MIEYHYDSKTKIFTHSSAAFPNPEEPGKYLISANSTTIEPPEEQAGYNRIWNADLEKWEYVKTALPQDFIDACAQFRQICHTIGEAIEDPDFKGGFDEMQEFASSPVYGTIEGLKLGLAWSAANENCQHQAAKIGIYKPGDATWWRMCWQLQELNQKE